MTLGSFFIVPANAYVNTFPILKYVPAWFPGAGFKLQAAYVKALVSEMQEEPFQFVKKNMAAGTAVPSLVHELLEGHHGESKEGEIAIKAISATAYGDYNMLHRHNIRLWLLQEPFSMPWC